jgi:WD40 repeat protein
MADVDLAPPDLHVGRDLQIFDLCFHPALHILAVGLVDGTVQLHHISPDAHALVGSMQAHTSACRGLDFSRSGTVMYSVSSDGSIDSFALDGGDIVRTAHCKNVRNAAVNALTVCTNDVIATGDDNGAVALWDVRTLGSSKKPVLQVKAHEDYISDMVYDPHSKVLAAVGSDGTLSAFNIRKMSHVQTSDSMDDELLSCTVVREGIRDTYTGEGHSNARLVVGTQEGCLNSFAWGFWGFWRDRLTDAHPMTVDTLATIGPNCIVSGAGDGLLRILRVTPLEVVDVLGDHGEFPVECLAVSHDGAMVASCSHESEIKFWDVRQYGDGKVDALAAARQQQREEHAASSSNPRDEKRPKNMSGNQRKRASFFKGILQDDEEEQGQSDEDME